MERKSIPKLIQKKSVFPQNPILTIINSFDKKISRKYEIEWDMNNCLSYEEKPGSWLPSNTYCYYYLRFDTFFE
uniref:Uncharacterized protein n=1 Tax=Ishige okamurae TaxID=233772 RepID=A0A8E5XRD0_9PHAE|nr:hypothetical protein Ycf34 [Ishige okamurae]QVJ99589.1 hypothetical protein Ycf34 [Ishige okamurae]